MILGYNDDFMRQQMDEVRKAVEDAGGRSEMARLLAPHKAEFALKRLKLNIDVLRFALAKLSHEYLVLARNPEKGARLLDEDATRLDEYMHYDKPGEKALQKAEDYYCEVCYRIRPERRPGLKCLSLWERMLIDRELPRLRQYTHLMRSLEQGEDA